MPGLCAEGVVPCWELLLKCTANRAVRGRTDFLRREVGVTHTKNRRERGNHQRVKNSHLRHSSAAEIKVNTGLSA